LSAASKKKCACGNPVEGLPKFGATKCYSCNRGLKPPVCKVCGETCCSVHNPQGEEEMSCELCARTTQPLTEHHLIPRARHNKQAVKKYGKAHLNKVAMLCRPCHSQIHDLFSESGLEKKYYTVELLKADASVIAWIEWVSKRPHWR
jgi:5-methylcytosine-specific restriction endonuclease McrA